MYGCSSNFYAHAEPYGVRYFGFPFSVPTDGTSGVAVGRVGISFGWGARYVAALDCVNHKRRV